MSRLGAYARTFTGFSRDARLFLLFTLVSGAALSLYWVDFNLYLAALGVGTPTIGIVATAGSLAGVLVAFPASAASDRWGRRLVMAAGIAVSAVALAGFLVFESIPVLILLGALTGLFLLGLLLILLDLGLPDADGQTLSVWLRGDPSLSSIPIIVLTAWPEEVVRQTVNAYNLNGYLCKPCSLPDLVKMIDSVLSTKSS